MKTFALTLFAALSIFIFTTETLAQQQRPPGGYNPPGRDQIPGDGRFPGEHGRWPGDDRWPDRDRPNRGGGASCAPEVLESNVAATDRTLKDVIASKDFKGATEFSQAVSQISALKNQNQKIDRYFELIGIDGQDSNEVAEFIGAREIKSDWIHSVQRSTGLNDKQADIVARKLQKALRGELK